MEIWLVDFEDATCAWSKREDAENYVKSLDFVSDIKEIERSDSYSVFRFTEKGRKDFTDDILITKTFLDEKPFF